MTEIEQKIPFWDCYEQYRTFLFATHECCFNEIFKNNLILLISVIIMFGPVPFISSQIAISLMLVTIHIEVTQPIPGNVDDSLTSN